VGGLPKAPVLPEQMAKVSLEELLEQRFLTVAEVVELAVLVETLTVVQVALVELVFHQP
jgi:hypothetical protein